MAALIAGACAACGGRSPEAPTPGPAGDRPRRIVSLDYCADQYVLKFADREHILAVSPDATEDFSYMRASAAGIKVVRPITENVLALKPDLVVRSYGAGPNATAFFERAGVRTLNVGWTDTIEDAMANIERMAAELGAREKGQAVVADMRTRLSALNKADKQTVALYMTLAGVTTGPGSLVHDIMRAAGLTNFQAAQGWRSLPLERLAYDQPDLIAVSFFETLTNNPDAWNPSKHPVAKAGLARANVAPLEGAWTVCGGWFLVDAVEALAAAAKK